MDKKILKEHKVLEKIAFEKSVIEVYEMVLSGKINRFPREFWDRETAIICLRYALEEKAKWTKEETFKNITNTFFKKYKLISPLRHIWGNRLINPLNDLYGEVNPFEVKGIQKNWKDENVKRDFIKWLIEDQLKWSEQDLKNNFSSSTFKEHSGFLKHAINGSLVYALQLAYPHIPIHEVKNVKVPTDYWDDKQELMKEVIIDCLNKNNIDLDKLPKLLTSRKCAEIFPFSIYATYFKKNAYELVNFVYPNKYKKEDFNTLWNR